MKKTVDYMLDVIRRIHTHDRWYNDSESQNTIALAEDLMRQLGMVDVETLRFPSDGKTSHGGWVMPLCWDARAGFLELLLPGGEKELLCSYKDTPCSLMLYSHPADVTAELALPDAEDVCGKIILFSHKHVSMAEVLQYLERGAVGFISAILAGPYYGKEGFEYLEDVTQWCNYTLPLWNVPQKPFGFSLTPRKGKKLEELIKSGIPVRLHAKVDTTLKAGTIPFVTGVLPGETDEEILLTGHLFEEGANDNASGAAASLAVIRSLAGKKLKRSIRLTFTNEARSYQAYLNHVKKIPRIAAGFVVDMVGVNLDNKGWTQDTDVVFPNFSVAVLKEFLARQGLEAGVLHQPDNDMALFEPPFNVPMTLMEFANDPNYHKSSDTPEKISREFIARTFTALCSMTEFLANAGLDEVPELAEMVCRFEQEKSHFSSKASERFACSRALKRLDSILRLVPAEEQEKAEKLLEKYKAQFGKEEKICFSEHPGLPAEYPKKLYRALFSFERYIDRKEQYPEISSLIRGWVAHNWVNNAMMLADGRRTASEILQFLREAGFEIDTALFNALLNFMVSEGFICILPEKEVLI